MINHNTVVNDHSSSDPTFAVSNDTNNEYDTSFLSSEMDLPANIPCSMHMQTYVMANGASTEPEALAEAEVTIDKGILASAITRFPMEVIERIIKWSVTPKGGKFKMPGLTMAEYKPGVNINVLLVK
jgi:nitrite reductase/ring-hydroxylating ferredoxin subunit